MPRNLYPTHTGRFGGLNRQLMYARGRTRSFRDRAYGYDRPSMPEGVAGQEWHPQAYQPSPVWADIEQRLHDIIRNPPKYTPDPTSDEERKQNQLYEIMHTPELIRERMRGETLEKISGVKASEKEAADNEKVFEKRMKLAEGKQKVWIDMLKQNKKEPGTFTKEDTNTARESYNAALREAHKAGEKAGWGDLSESYPEVGASGMTLKMEKQIEEKKAAQKAETERIEAGPFEDYGPEVIFEVQPGPGSEQESIDRLSKIGGAMDRALAQELITKEKYDAAVEKITAGTTGEERLRKAREVLQSNADIMRILETEMLTERERQSPIKMPQSIQQIAGEATLPEVLPGEASEEPAPGLPGSLSPQDELGKVPGFLGSFKAIGDEPIRRVR